MKPRVILAIAIIGSLLAISAAALQTYLGFTRLLAHSDRVSHTLTVLNQIHALQSRILDAETNARSFVLSHRSEFLDPFQASLRAIPGDYQLLQRLTVESPDQRARLVELDPMIQTTVSQLRAMVQAKLVGPDEEVGDDGEIESVATESIRAVLATMTDEEARLYLGQTAGLQGETRITILFLLTTVAACVVLVALGFSLMLGEAGRRRRSEQQLHTLNAELEERVAARTAELAKTNELLTAIITSSPLAIVTLNEHKVITSWNRRAEDLFGLPAAKMIGTVWILLQDVAGIGFAKLFSRAASGELITGIAAIYERADGCRLHITLAASPFHFRDRKRRGAVLVLEDVTERRLVEDQLRQAQKMEAVGQLTGGLAHDFNNLLAVIIGNLSFVADSLQGHPASQPIQAALKGALRGAELTRQLLVCARQQPLQPHEVRIDGLVDRIAVLLRRSLGEAIEVRTTVQPDLWLALVDPSQVESALLNLAINARDAMPQGGLLHIEVKNAQLDLSYVARNPHAQPGDYIEIAVTDTGTGIPPEIIGRIFEPFFTTKQEGQGTGLGLSMIYGFAKQSHGHVSIESELGIGTTVRLYVPRARPHISDDLPVAATNADHRGRGQVILVVEDNAEVRDVVCKQLSALGYRTVETADGREAMTLLQSDIDVDLLFTDVVMPGGLSGPDLVREARGLRPQLKVLYTSGFPEASRGAMLADRRDPLLRKPYRQQELARQIVEVLSAEPIPISA